ncbi:MAG: hypothetical protein Q8Q14_11970 [Gemmatimonadales bacterium]|nr:hypothetical protein [Gemmatimonadales bacterium]
MRILLFLVVAAQEPPSPPKRALEFSGLVLVNGFYNTARVNNSDVPQFAENDPASIGGTGGSIRQTRLGLIVSEPDVLGGDFSGEIDADFFGGQLPSSGGRTFPLLRLRRATGTVTWRHVQLLIGQESPLVAERSPRSLAAMGFPGFAGAGNLWLWIPQLRLGAEFGYTLRLAVQAAVLAPGTGTPQGAFATQPDSAERSGRPYLQGRVRLAWGPADDPSEIAVGGHMGWLLGADSTTGDSVLASQAITADARIRLGGVLELIAEAYAGQAVAGLGGGGIGQNVGARGVPVRSKGGWVQLNVRPSAARWMVGGGCGLDDPDDADVTAAGRFKNVVCEGHIEWRPGGGPMLFGLEYRRLETTYQAGTMSAGHINLAAGYRF